MYSQFRPLLLASFLTSLIFFIVLSMGLPFFFFFLSGVPLLHLGLSRSTDMAFFATLFATLLITLFAGVGVAITFLLMVFLPSWFIGRQAMLYQVDDSGARHWYPLGHIWLTLTICACSLILLLALYHMGGEQTLPDILSQRVRTLFANFPDVYANAVDALARRPFLIFAFAIWLWGIFLFLQAGLTHYILVKQGKNTRPNMVFTPFAMPSWMFVLLGLCALASFVGSPSLQFVGNACLLGLSMPYFFLGASYLHAKSKQWPNRVFLLAIFYFFAVAQLWPALLVAGYGFWQHARTLNKRLPPANS